MDSYDQSRPLQDSPFLCLARSEDVRPGHPYALPPISETRASPGKLWHQLFSPHVSIESVFMTTIHRPGILNRLVTLGIRHTTRIQDSTARSNFQCQCIFIACQTSF